MWGGGTPARNYRVKETVEIESIGGSSLFEIQLFDWLDCVAIVDNAACRILRAFGWVQPSFVGCGACAPNTYSVELSS